MAMSADAAMTMNVLFHYAFSSFGLCRFAKTALQPPSCAESCALGSSGSRGVGKTSVVGTVVVLRRQIEQGNRGPQHSVQTRFAHRAGTRDVTDLAAVPGNPLTQRVARSVLLLPSRERREHDRVQRAARPAPNRQTRSRSLESEGSPVEHPSGTGAGPAEGWHQKGDSNDENDNLN